MVLVNIESLVIGFTPMPSVLTLRCIDKGTDVEDDLVLPIVIGTMEATAIAAALEETQTERPLTHKLAVDLLGATGASISRVVIDRVDGSMFYCTIYMRCANGMFTRVDARPSDGIALAIRSNAPLFVDDEVMRIASCPRALSPGNERKVELEEFDKFIEQVSPEDFITHENPNGK